MKATHFKILEWRGDKYKVLGLYPEIIGNENELGATNAPTLMTMKATKRKLQNMYPSINFKDVNIITVKLSGISTYNG